MSNPWIVDDAFDDMFVDAVSLGSQPGALSVLACVFPAEDVDPFAESTTSNAAKALNVLARQADLSAVPKTGDALRYGGEDWLVADVEREQTWYRILARSKS